ncbi:MAG: DUF5990 family protein [Blastocatellales bacterium]
MELTIKVICVNLPGDKFVSRQGDETTISEGVYLGIQKAEEVVGAAPGNSKKIVFEPAFRVSPLPGGRTNFLGPFAKGTPKERFFYLSWVVKDAGGRLTMFRRAKIHLSHLPWSRVEEAVRAGKPLSVELSMTDRRGGPLCGSVRDDDARWQG